MSERTHDQRGGTTGIDQSLFVGIPAYNEEGTIGDIVSKVQIHVEDVIVVDDGSDDQTATRAENEGAIVIRHDQNRGYGAALQTVFDSTFERAADLLVVMDADGQHSPEDIQKLVKAQRSSGANIVIGSRFTTGAHTDAPIYRRLGLLIINTITNVGLQISHGTPWISDTQSGFRVYDSSMIELISQRAALNEGMDASIDILFQAAKADKEFFEHPVYVSYDVEDANTHHPFVQGMVLLANLLTQLHSNRSVRFLGLSGLLCILAGGGLTLSMLSGSVLAQVVPVVTVGILLSIGGVLSGAAIVFGKADR